MKYEINEVDSFEANGIVKVVELKRLITNGLERVYVWLEPDGTARCTACSGPLVAMSKSCGHVRMVKRWDKKQQAQAELVRIEAMAKPTEEPT